MSENSFFETFKLHETCIQSSLPQPAFITITLHMASSFKMLDSGCVCCAMDELNSRFGPD